MLTSHQYDVPGGQISQPPTATQQLKARSATMPPPTTPASQLRKRKAAKTPASGLDLRYSITPYRTPSRVSQNTSGLDNGALAAAHDEDEDGTYDLDKDDWPSKRVKSVHTSCMLDAAGLSSSPAPFA
jgi:hypothetical protein